MGVNRYYWCFDVYLDKNEYEKFLYDHFPEANILCQQILKETFIHYNKRTLLKTLFISNLDIFKLGIAHSYRREAVNLTFNSFLAIHLDSLIRRIQKNICSKNLNDFGEKMRLIRYLSNSISLNYLKDYTKHLKNELLQESNNNINSKSFEILTVNKMSGLKIIIERKEQAIFGILFLEEETEKRHEIFYFIGRKTTKRRTFMKLCEEEYTSNIRFILLSDDIPIINYHYLIPSADWSLSFQFCEYSTSKNDLIENSIFTVNADEIINELLRLSFYYLLRKLIVSQEPNIIRKIGNQSFIPSWKSLRIFLKRVFSFFIVVSPVLSAGLLYLCFLYKKNICNVLFSSLLQTLLTITFGFTFIIYLASRENALRMNTKRILANIVTNCNITRVFGNKYFSYIRPDGLYSSLESNFKFLFDEYQEKLRKSEEAEVGDIKKLLSKGLFSNFIENFASLLNPFERLFRS